VLADEITEETVLKTAPKDATAAAASTAAETELQLPHSHLMPHDAVEPSKHSHLHEIR